jgi:hypothetical protein
VRPALLGELARRLDPDMAAAVLKEHGFKVSSVDELRHRLAPLRTNQLITPQGAGGRPPVSHPPGTLSPPGREMMVNESWENLPLGEGPG